jgi:hypothetical protein
MACTVLGSAILLHVSSDTLDTYTFTGIFDMQIKMRTHKENIIFIFIGKIICIKFYGNIKNEFENVLLFFPKQLLAKLCHRK